MAEHTKARPTEKYAIFLTEEERKVLLSFIRDNIQNARDNAPALNAVHYKLNYSKPEWVF